MIAYATRKLMRNFSNFGIFKTLAVSKIVHLGLITCVPAFIMEQLNMIKRNFIWQGKKSKIKCSTLQNNYKLGGLKDTDISIK